MRCLRSSLRSTVRPSILRVYERLLTGPVTLVTNPIPRRLQHHLCAPGCCMTFHWDINPKIRRLAVVEPYTRTPAKADEQIQE